MLASRMARVPVPRVFCQLAVSPVKSRVREAVPRESCEDSKVST